MGLKIYNNQVYFYSGCIPGQAKMEDCNVCTCLPARVWACTRMACRNKRGAKTLQLARKKPPAAPEGKCCIPNTTYMEECNVCLCAEDGIGAFCTLVYCDRGWDK
ncbi:serine protease inhibitor I/II-like [Schistocerca piceifrons]|uniref:serine protease inhibitor I/II-like n=1 Tax=Schistocerca piceifrons TaxID=274613 RepID=UPI001F5FE100|nr:serine protease inhibitor I/II-like [Schistocerca piceifrons]